MIVVCVTLAIMAPVWWLPHMRQADSLFAIDADGENGSANVEAMATVAAQQMSLRRFGT